MTWIATGAVRVRNLGARALEMGMSYVGAASREHGRKMKGLGRDPPLRGLPLVARERRAGRHRHRRQRLSRLPRRLPGVHRARKPARHDGALRAPEVPASPAIGRSSTRATARQPAARRHPGRVTPLAGKRGTRQPLRGALGEPRGWVRVALLVSGLSEKPGPSLLADLRLDDEQLPVLAVLLSAIETLVERDLQKQVRSPLVARVLRPCWGPVPVASRPGELLLQPQARLQRAPRGAGRGDQSAGGESVRAHSVSRQLSTRFRCAGDGSPP